MQALKKAENQNFGHRGATSELYRVSYKPPVLSYSDIETYVFLPKMSAYRKDFDETNYMSFLMKDDELLEKYNETWKKVKDSFKREFDSKPVYLKAKKNPITEKSTPIFTIIRY